MLHTATQSVDEVTILEFLSNDPDNPQEVVSVALLTPALGNSMTLAFFPCWVIHFVLLVFRAGARLLITLKLPAVLALVPADLF